VAASAATARLPEIRELRVMGVLLAPAVNPQRTTNSGLLMKRMNLLARASSGSLQVVPLFKITAEAATICIVVLILIRLRIRIVARHLF
jgi:hypothetical protein